MMVHAKNYETMLTFVEVTQKKLCPLYFWTRCSFMEGSSCSALVKFLDTSAGLGLRQVALCSSNGAEWVYSTEVNSGLHSFAQPSAARTSRTRPTTVDRLH